MDRLVEIKDLLPGMVIVKVTRQNGPIKIRKSGLVTSQEMVSGLGEMGVQQVEIDPAQTVEFERPKAQKSQTQQLLQSAKRSDHGIDNALSEQFNRSLFLPSIQQIPALWQYNAKRFATALGIIACGLGIGWFGATYQHWLTNDSNALTANPPSTMEAQNPNATAIQTVPTLGETKDDKQQLVPPGNPLDQPEVTVPSVVKALPAASIPAESLATQPPAEEDAQPQAPAISTELLKRFEKAINEMDNEPTSEFQSRSNTASDVPRIDQLPAWVLTKLPAMAFSAHMYASKPQDRWVRVNGKRMVEGDMIDDNLQIQSIDPQHVILNYEGQVFSMSALTDW